MGAPAGEYPSRLVGAKNPPLFGPAKEKRAMYEYFFM